MAEQSGRSNGPSRRFGSASNSNPGRRSSGSKPRDGRPSGAAPKSGKPKGASPRSGKPKGATSRSGATNVSGRRGPSGDRRPAGERSGPRAAGGRTPPGQARPAVDRGPRVDPDVTGRELERTVREELRTLSRDAAETVARHLVMSARLLDEHPEQAWEHAQAAVTRGGRLAVVREAAGIAAYRAGEYASALGQFRAARRISGSDAYWPMMADCERGLGRPERALAMAGAPEARRLDRAGEVEMRIVAAGARRDLDQLDAAIVTLQCPALESSARAPWSARLKFAYADALAAAGRGAEAREWFERAAAADADDETDAAERLAELDGVVWIDAELDADDTEDSGGTRDTGEQDA